MDEKLTARLDRLESLLCDLLKRTAVEPHDKLIKLPEAAERLGLSKRQVGYLQAKGKLPFVKVKTSVRFRVGDLAAYIEENTVKVDYKEPTKHFLEPPQSLPKPQRKKKAGTNPGVEFLKRHGF